MTVEIPKDDALELRMLLQALTKRRDQVDREDRSGGSAKAKTSDLGRELSHQVEVLERIVRQL